MSDADVVPDPLPLPAQPGPFNRTVRVPGSKSLTNRLYVLAALSRGASAVRRPLRSDDTDRLLAAINALGIRSEWRGEDVIVHGGAGRLPRGGRVDLGDGGTPTRFLLALATRAAESVVVDGSPRMRERPIDEGVALLRRLGADLRGTMVDGVERLPVTVEVGPARDLEGGKLEVGRTASSQFLSALLLIAPTIRHGLELRYAERPTSESYLELTVDAMRLVGLAVDVDRGADGRLLAHRVPPSPIEAFDRQVEADASSAAYFAVAAAITPGGRVRLEGVPATSVQPDLALLDALRAMGATVTRDATSIEIVGPRELRPFEGDAAQFPDASLALAAACSRARGISRIAGLATLAVKESDRIAALASELTKLGCRCEATRDALTIDPAGAHDRPVTIATYRDHRIAMSFAALSVVRPAISIADPGCVAKSYPGFWRDFLPDDFWRGSRYASHHS